MSYASLKQAPTRDHGFASALRAADRRIESAGRSAVTPATQLFLHPSLQSLMSEHSKEFIRLGLPVTVVDNVVDRLDAGCRAAVALPATNADRLDLVTQIARDFPFTAVLAAVIDPTGLVSSRAIDAGACWVLNLLIPSELTVPTLAQQLLTHLDFVTDEQVADPPRQLAPVAMVHTAQPAREADGCKLTAVLPTLDPDHELLHLLVVGESTPQLARRFYCSERSMYRRLRRVYDRVGVRGRFELINRLGAAN